MTPRPSLDSPLSRGLKRSIGWLTVLLVPALTLGFGSIPISVSDFYYTPMRHPYQGAMFVLAILFLGHLWGGSVRRFDTIMSTLAGGAALLVALFPSYNPTLNHIPGPLLIPLVSIEECGWIHTISASVLFLCFAVLSQGDRGGRSPPRGPMIQRLSGVGIVVCILGIAWETLTAADQSSRDRQTIFWPESVALTLFGLSWLLKDLSLGAEKSTQKRFREKDEESSKARQP